MSLDSSFAITEDQITFDNYRKYQALYAQNQGHEEMYHQIGRLSYLKQIVENVKKAGLVGDFIEFGTYHGMYLIWMARFRDKFGLNDRRLFGVDSFKGLPVGTDRWFLGQFASDRQTLERNLEAYLTPVQRKNIYVLEGLFSDVVIPKEVTNIAIAHLDCDLKVSAMDAFKLLEPFVRKNPMYLLFDDWGCTDVEIPAAFAEWQQSHKDIKAECIGTAKFFKYFYIQTGQ